MQGRNRRTRNNPETIGEVASATSENATAPPLWRGVTWFFVGNLIYVASQWGVLSVLSKLGSPEVVGRFALGLAITTPVIMFFNMQLRQLQATDAIRKYAFGDYLGLRIFTTLIAFLVMVGIVSAAGYSVGLASIILVVGLAKSLEALSDVFYGFFQHHERIALVSRAQVTQGLLSLCALSVAFHLTGDLLIATTAWAATWALRVIYDVRNGMQVLVQVAEDAAGSQTIKPRWNPAVLGELAYLALPLGFAVSLSLLSINAPRYFVVHYLGEYDLGIFAALSYVIVSSRLVALPLGQAASPRLARYYARGDRRAFSILVVSLGAISGLMGVMGILVSLVAGRWILSLLYTPEYANYTSLFVWIMLATGLNYVASVMNQSMTAARHLRIQVLISTGVVVTTTVGCLVLIPQIGILGAGMAVALGQAFYLFGTLSLISYIMKKM